MHARQMIKFSTFGAPLSVQEAHKQQALRTEQGLNGGPLTWCIQDVGYGPLFSSRPLDPM